jgi:hypothetical protein
MKIRRKGAELFHAEGQTDVTKLTAAFRDIANAPKIKPLGKRRFCFHQYEIADFDQIAGGTREATL